VTRDDVQRWLDGYVSAWHSYDPAEIGALFSHDATYRYHPYDEPMIGRDSIVADWLESPDADGSWEAHYEPYTVDGDRAVAVGESRYLHPDGSFRTLYHNIWMLRFDDAGRCADFVEYFMERPKGREPS
jgi:hypothetical protein